MSYETVCRGGSYPCFATRVQSKPNAPVPGYDPLDNSGVVKQLAANVPAPCGERVTRPPFIKPGDVSKPQDLGIVPKPPAGGNIFKQMKP